jgi:NAD-dependent deacetylase
VTPSQIADVARRLAQAERAVALTGAGVSTDSGIPDFRSAQSGLWEEHDPMRVASLEGFRADPFAFYGFWGARFRGLSDKAPNPTHELVARLEAMGRLRAVITQNIDGLHREAGSRFVHEVHGTYTRARCLRCGIVYPLDLIVERVEAGQPPFCDSCGDLVKPDVVLFGEPLPPIFERSAALVREADLLLVLGTSLEVHPVAGLVPLARETGAEVIIVNRDESAYDHLATHLVRAELTPFSIELLRLLAH